MELFLCGLWISPRARIHNLGCLRALCRHIVRDMNFFETARAYANMVKIEHTLFALPFALSGLCLARLEGFGFGAPKLCLAILAFAAARAAAMGFNRVADAEIDAANERTKNRPIQSGKISLADAKLFTALSAAAFCAFAFSINRLCGFLSFPALAVLFGYSYAKRFTAFAHYFLGLALALAPIGAWIAAAGTLDWRIIALGAGLMFHISGFDLFYSLQDREFDVSFGLRSIPAAFGVRATFAFAAASFALAGGLFFAVGVLFGLVAAYFACVYAVCAGYAAGWFALLRGGLKFLNAVFTYVNIGASAVILFGICAEFLK